MHVLPWQFCALICETKLSRYIYIVFNSGKCIAIPEIYLLNFCELNKTSNSILGFCRFRCVMESDKANRTCTAPHLEYDNEEVSLVDREKDDGPCYDTIVDMLIRDLDSNDYKTNNDSVISEESSGHEAICDVTLDDFDSSLYQVQLDNILRHTISMENSAIPVEITAGVEFQNEKPMLAKMVDLNAETLAAQSPDVTMATVHKQSQYSERGISARNTHLRSPMQQADVTNDFVLLDKCANERAISHDLTNVGVNDTLHLIGCMKDGINDSSTENDFKDSNCVARTDQHDTFYISDTGCGTTHTEINGIQQQNTDNIEGTCETPNKDTRYVEDKLPANFEIDKSKDINHFDQQVPPSDQSYSCEVCYCKFSDLSILTKHIAAHSCHAATSVIVNNMSDSVSSDSAAKCEMCDKIFTKQSSLRRHMRNKHGQINVTSRDCSHGNKTFKQANQLQQHMLSHTGRKSHGCALCDKTFTRAMSLKEHMYMHTGDKPHACEICSDRCLKPHLLKRHLLRHAEGEYTCSVCLQLFTQACLFQEHMQTHVGERPHVCVHCMMRFTDASDLTEHLAKHPSPKSEDLPENTEKKVNLIQDTHHNDHSSEQLVDMPNIPDMQRQIKHKCLLCSKVFASARSLSAHNAIHTGVKPHMCEICGNSFTRNRSLQHHMLIHTGDKSYACEICGKKFLSTSHLKSHMLTHTGTKSHICDVCGSSFTRARSLKDHMSVHTGEKNHMCLQCGKAFRLANHLREHMRTHDNTMTHLCPTCGRWFARERSMKEHMLTHYKEKTFLCSECGKEFHRASALRKHMMTHSKSQTY